VKVEKKRKRISKNAGGNLIIFTGKDGKYMWELGDPDKNNLRTVAFNGRKKGRGILEGSIEKVAGGYKAISSFIKVGGQLGIKILYRPEPTLLISSQITSIYHVFEKE